jgi:hypothetical protein
MLPIRYSTHVWPVASATWGGVGLSFLQSLVSLYPEEIWVTAIEGAPMGILGGSSPWAPLSKYFARNTAAPTKDFINIVCGPGENILIPDDGEISSLWEDMQVIGHMLVQAKRKWIKGEINIAITGPWPKALDQAHVDALNQYDQVWATNSKDYLAMESLGIKKLELVAGNDPIHIGNLLKL